MPSGTSGLAELLVESSPDALVAFATDGKVLFWNRAAESIFGWSRDDAVGRSLFELIFPAERRAEMEHTVRRAMETGFALYRSVRRPGAAISFGDAAEKAVRVSRRPVRNEQGKVEYVVVHKETGAPRVKNGRELYGHHKDGGEFPIEINLSPLETAAGVVAVAVIRDVTPQRELQEQVRKQNRELSDTTAFLNNILESSTEYSIIALDLDGRVVAWNEGARRNYGYTEAEMMGKDSRMLNAAHELESGRHDAALGVALRMGKFEGEFLRRRKNGEEFTAQVVLTLRRDAAGKPIGYLSIASDITSRKALEEQLRRKSELLEDQNRRVEEASRMKSAFLANMSHELRTPLNAIIGFSELMADGTAGPINDKQKEYLDDVLQGARHLLQLINEVLDLSKVEAGKMEFRPERVDPVKLVEEVRDNLRTLASEKRIRVETEIDPRLGPIFLDPARLKQVVYNYLSNALKFTPEAGRVVIRVSDGDGEFRLEVKDTGVGILPEDMERLFVVFQQLESPLTKTAQGTGLGLALVKRIVEAQGGRVGATSTPGEGSTFYAVLPCRVAPEAAAGAEAPPRKARSGGAASASKAVLVVEDDPKDRAWLVSALTGAGYTVETAETGAEAVEKVRNNVYAAVTLDLVLPDMGGMEVLKNIRTASKNPDVPVVVVTVAAQRKAGMGFRIHDFLPKPARAEDVLASLESAGVPADGSRKVLVVDDDPYALKLMEAALGRLGYRPICRANGTAGLRAAEDEHPAAVVLDLRMEEVDGFEFLERFRRTPEGRTTPVIVWTSQDVTPDDRLRLRAMAQGFVVKTRTGKARLLDELKAFVPPPPRGSGSPGPHRVGGGGGGPAHGR